MNRISIRLTVRRPHWLIVLSLAACRAAPPAADAGADSVAATGPAVPGTWVYACPGGERFLVRIQADSAIVEVPPRVYRLPQVIAASGVRYEAGGTELWTKGDEARLTAPGASHDGCTGTRADKPWDAARLMGYELRAVGQEPGWVLDIDQDGGLSYVGDYGSTRFVAPLGTPTHDSSGVTYRASADGHDLAVTIRETPCQDVMSGEAFTHTVSLVVDGRDLNGCGRALQTPELTGKYWKLIELEGAAAVAAADAREPHLRLIAENSRAAGSTGCNRFSGTFERGGDTIRFGPLAMTRMACVDPAMNRQEQDFVRVLEAVNRFAVRNDSLTLFTGDRPAARFVAVYLR